VQDTDKGGTIGEDHIQRQVSLNLNYKHPYRLDPNITRWDGRV